MARWGRELVVNGDGVVPQNFKIVVLQTVFLNCRSLLSEIVCGNPELEQRTEISTLRVFQKLHEVKKKNFVLEDVHDAHVATAVLTENVDLRQAKQYKNLSTRFFYLIQETQLNDKWFSDKF